MANTHFQIKKKSKTVSTFLKKTFDLLNDQQNDNYIRWASSGVGFIITNQEQFSKNILPKYFKHSNYSSFVRQLNMYNFHKIRQNSSESYFHHECFDRNNRSALVDIHRKPQKKKKKTHQSEEQIGLKLQEINFNTKKIFKFKKGTLANLSINLILDNNSQIKVSSEKNTQNIFDEQGLVSMRNVGMPMDSDNLSVEVQEQRGQRGQRRQIVATREMINASNNNIFPVSIQNVQSSILSIFY